MENKKSQKKLGEPGYLNKNCWLVRNLNYNPYKRCQYCELKFHNCLFLHYQALSAFLIILIFIFSFLIERKISEFLIISVFTLVIIYGYFFNKSTDKLILASFKEKKAKEFLENFNKILQQKVDEQTKNIIALSEMKSEFLKIVNHQLRTPASIIMNYLSMIQEGLIKEEEIKEVINKLIFSSQRLITILDDLLDAQELVGEKIVLNPKPCQIEDIILEVFNRFQFIASQRNIILKLEKLQKPLPQILLDEKRIKKAISKLIDNAILYTEKGEVGVELGLIKKDKKDFLQIKIRDTGIGITQEDMGKIFKIFSRGKEGIKMHPNGSGLGLYIAKEYIKAHQGEIEAQSQGKDKGSTFIITLPVITEGS
ncbi:MAG: sensor histidine kinase [Patescibacteria group bacterium]